MHSSHRLLVAGLAAGLTLSACIPVPIPVQTEPRTFVTGYRYQDYPDPGPAPASSRCEAPARASAEASAVIASVNAQRKASGLPSLKPSSTLMKVAQGHACDNAARGGHSHVGSDGSTLTTRLRRSGYKLSTAAENTGWGFDSAQRAMTYWMKSSGHRDNILNPGVTEIGVGLADGARPSWVLVMAKRR